MTQSTLIAFSQLSDPVQHCATLQDEAQNCTTCTIQHTIIGDRVRCVFLGEVRPIPAHCKNWQPPDPLRYWPPLAPNFSTPKKWLGRS